MPFRSLFAMSTFLFTLLGLSVGTSFNCVLRRDISPCTCRTEPGMATIYVTCERMTSFAQVAEALADRFPPEQEISLGIAYSELDDLTNHSISDLGLTITSLKLNHDNLSHLNATLFEGLGRTEYLSLADNSLPDILHSREILKHMPLLKTFDLGRTGLQEIKEDDFRDVRKLQHLVLPGNSISQMDRSSIPSSLRSLHLGRNQLTDLNGTLRELTELEWVFLNGNHLTTLEDQLPLEAAKLYLFHMGYNKLEKLPQEFRNYPRIESVYFNHNELRGLNGAMQKSRRLKRLYLSHNKIEQLSEDEFLEADRLDDLQLGNNLLTSLNNSLLPIRALRCLNLTHNLLTEFSLQQIRGLRALRVVDLSNNRIAKLGGRMEQNLVESETPVEELKLEHNLLRSLDGALMGLHRLERLNLSHNLLESISPDDLIGLEQLMTLDISFNQLTTLEETSKTFLPLLNNLHASHNALTILERDFYGLPVLCLADVSNNQIRVVSRELTNKTRCRIHGVFGTLQVHLHGNPVLCDENHNETVAAMELNFTTLLGFAVCDVANVTEVVIVE